MKIKFFNKNLCLNKTTIANLDAADMADINGGCTTETLEVSCDACSYICEPFDNKTTANTCGL